MPEKIAEDRIKRLKSLFMKGVGIADAAFALSLPQGTVSTYYQEFTSSGLTTNSEKMQQLLSTKPMQLKEE